MDIKENEDKRNQNDLRPIPGFPKYLISDKGEIFSLFTRRFLTPIPNWLGDRFYFVITLCPGRKRRLIHRLVAETFIGPPPFEGALVRHSDGDSLSNFYQNLAWGTTKENSQDSIAHGTHAAGSWQGSSKLTPLQVVEIRSIPKEIRSHVVAVNFNISSGQIRKIRRGVQWKTLK